MTYSPLAFVVAVCTALVSVCVAVSSEFATAAPLGSLTLPTICAPATAWPRIGIAETSNSPRHIPETQKSHKVFSTIYLPKQVHYLTGEVYT
jgi:hypothetical protein